MHGNRVLDLIFVMFWSHALTHPCGGPRIIICEPSKYESRFLAVSFCQRASLLQFSEILSSAS